MSKYYREGDEKYYKQYVPITILEAWCDFGLNSLSENIKLAKYNCEVN